MCDKELERVQSVYRENEEIFQKIQNREEMWSKFLDFEVAFDVV